MPMTACWRTPSAWRRADQVLPNLPEPDLENPTIDLARHARAVEPLLKETPVARAPSAEPESAPESRPEKVTPIRANPLFILDTEVASRP